jgi:hypothetical protein
MVLGPISIPITLIYVWSSNSPLSSYGDTANMQTINQEFVSGKCGLNMKNKSELWDLW